MIICIVLTIIALVGMLISIVGFNLIEKEINKIMEDDDDEHDHR